MAREIVIVGPQAGEATILGREALLEQACELIVDAGQAGAGWIIFPEAYLPGGPSWLWQGLDGEACAGELRAAALACAVDIPGAISDRLCRVARRSGVGVAIGLVERDGATCYNSLLIIDAQGRIRGHYREDLGPARQQQRWSLVASSPIMAGEQAQAPPDWAGGI